MEYWKLLESDRYSFLKTDPHLGDRIILLGLGGSRAYGTDVAESDVDLRGVCIEKKSELVGLDSFEQFEDRNTDTVIYGFNKFAHLLLQCNPSVIELLGLDEGDYFTMSREGRLLYDHRHDFLSRKAVRSMQGYIEYQLRRL